MSMFFNRKKKDTNSTLDASKHTDETMSEPSDDQSQNSSSNLSVEASPKRRSIFGSIAANFRRSGDNMYDLASDCTIDDQIKSLYIDSDELEQRCKFDAKKFNMKYGLKAEEDQDIDTSFIPKQLAPKKTSDSVIENLYEGYFNTEFDPVYMQLNQVFEWLDSKDCDMNMRFMAAIEEADTDKDMVMSKLAYLIETNRNAITESQNDIFSLDVDLARAATQISISRRKMGNAVSIMNKGSIKVTQLQKKKEKLTSIQDMLKNFKVLNKLSETAIDLSLNGDFSTAAYCSFNLITATMNPMYEKFNILESIREKAFKSLPMVRINSDKALDILCCRRFESAQYGNIIKTYLIFDYMRDSFGVELMNGLSRNRSGSTSQTPRRPSTKPDNSTAIDTEDCMNELANRIVKYQSNDILNCMRSAVLEFIYMNQSKRRANSADMNEEEPNFADLELEELYTYITPDISVNCIIRSCELLMEIVHTHYLISQWHRSPFDPKNMENVHLHRNAAILKDEIDLVSNFSDEDAEEEDEEGMGLGIRSSSIDESSRGDYSPENVNPIPDDTENSKDLKVISDDINNNSSNDKDNDNDDEKNVNSSDDLKSDLKSDLENEESGPKNEQQVNHAIQTERSNTSTPTKSPTMLRPRSSSAASHRSRHNKAVAGSSKDYLICLDNLKEDILGEHSKTIISQSTRLKLVYAQLVSSRVELWEQIEDAIWLLLKTVQFNSSIILDDFLTMSWALNTLVELGNEFCMAKSRALSSCIAEKSSRYLEDVHKDSFLMLKQMIDAESWRSIPIDLNEYGGVLGIIKTNLSRSQFANSAKQKIRLKGLICQNVESKSTEPSSNVIQSKHLINYFSFGNPFSLVSEEPSETNSTSSSSSNVLETLFDDEENLKENVNRKNNSTSLVLTQSCLNGLSNFIGKYIQLMFVVKNSSVDIFEYLCQLFDFYVCSVFYGFVPMEQRQKLLSNYTRQNSPPPNSSKDFQALQTYTARIFETFIPGSKSMKESLRFADIFTVPSILQNESDDINVELPSNSSSSSNVGVKYYVNEHLVAAESCWFSAHILKEMKTKILVLLPENYHDKCTKYVSDLQVVVGQLQSLVYRGICPQLCANNSLLSRLSECQWESKKQTDSINPWVDVLVNNCKDVWEFLNEDNEYSYVHQLAKEQMWMELCQAAFDLVLDAFSIAKKNSKLSTSTTSSENTRQSILSDINSLQTSLELIHGCRPARGKEYLEEFIRATGLSEDDMMNWVRENWQIYAYRHLNTLINQTLGSVLKKNKLKDSLSILDSLYDQEQKFQAGPKSRRSILGFTKSS